MAVPLFRLSFLRLIISWLSPYFVSHAPIRDGAAKGKIERFFRGFRDRFLVVHHSFDSLHELNQKAADWIENQYNYQPHSAIGMKPIDRFNLDHSHIQYLPCDEFTDEVFFIEVERKVNAVNVFSLHSQKFECPYDLRNKTIQIRYNRKSPERYIVYYQHKRMGNASPLNLYLNAKQTKSGASS